MTSKKPKSTRTKISKTPVKVRSRVHPFETDSLYLLKLILVILLGSFWVKFGTPIVWQNMTFYAVPVGVLAGLVLIRTLEHFQSDRKIWYAMLIVIGVVSALNPAGIVI